MIDGKKAIIERIVYSVFAKLKNQIKYITTSQFLVNKLVEAQSVIELKVRRRSRKYILVPFPIKIRRQLTRSLSKLVYLIRGVHGKNRNKKKRLKISLKQRVLIGLSNLNNPTGNKLLTIKAKYYSKIIQNKNYINYRWI
jgi:ribosomal protein S7